MIAPAAFCRSATDMPMRIGPAASADTVNPAGAGVGAGAAAESAAGGALSALAAESVDPGDFSMVQAAAASSRNGNARTVQTSSAKFGHPVRDSRA